MVSVGEQQIAMTVSKLNRRIKVSYKEKDEAFELLHQEFEKDKTPASARNIVNASPTYGTASSGTNSVT